MLYYKQQSQVTAVSNLPTLNEIKDRMQPIIMIADTTFDALLTKTLNNILAFLKDLHIIIGVYNYEGFLEKVEERICVDDYIEILKEPFVILNNISYYPSNWNKIDAITVLPNTDYFLESGAEAYYGRIIFSKQLDLYNSSRNFVVNFNAGHLILPDDLHYAIISHVIAMFQSRDGDCCDVCDVMDKSVVRVYGKYQTHNRKSIRSNTRPTISMV